MHIRAYKSPHNHSFVSNAGAIGCITALTLPSPEALQAEIRLCKQLTTKPFGVSLSKSN